jgi:hypothetical protein
MYFSSKNSPWQQQNRKNCIFWKETQDINKNTCATGSSMKMLIVLGNPREMASRAWNSHALRLGTSELLTCPLGVHKGA